MNSETDNFINQSLKPIIEEINWQTVLKTMEIRLQGIRDVTKRARFSFIVLIIASCAVFIAIWNGHFSWNRKVAFPSDMNHCLDDVAKYGTQELKVCLETLKAKTKNKETIEEIDLLLKDERLGLKNFPKTEPDKNLLSLEEHNRRNFTYEWLKSTNISVGLLGVVVHMNDLNILGSITLMLISFWFVFNVRRENRAIVGLLKDVRNITEFDKSPDKSLKNDAMLVASMAFQEVAHSLTFVSIAKDYPLSSKHIFDETQSETKTDVFVRFIIYRLRAIGMFFLLLLPAIVISVTIYADWSSLSMNTAFSENFPKIESSLSLQSVAVFARDMYIAIICFIITLIICSVSIIYQHNTTDALYVFAEKLGIDVEPNFRKKYSTRKKTA